MGDGNARRACSACVAGQCVCADSCLLCGAHRGIGVGGWWVPAPAVQARMVGYRNPWVVKPRWQCAVDCLSVIDVMDTSIVNRVPAASGSAVS